MNRIDRDKYEKLLAIKERHGFESMDEAHVFDILNRRSLGRRKALGTIKNILNKEKPRSKRSENTGRKWYTERFSDGTYQLDRFLTLNESVVNLGHYDLKNKVFDNYLKQRILVDASNVAWNSGSASRKDRPKAANIELVASELHKRGFLNTTIVCDANLGYKIDDVEVYRELQKSMNIQVVLPNTSADLKLIEEAKSKDFSTKVITNDTFQDWRLRDPWVREHIHEFRASFKISGEKVEFFNLGEPNVSDFVTQDLESLG